MPAPQERQILIGVYVAAHDHALAATLASLFENTPMPFGLRLLPDPADEAEAVALQARFEALPGLEQLRGPVHEGAAACFNRLVGVPADIYVFLENGARVTPGWLELLLAALDADPSHGLAGPSTNRCWNEQAVAPACGESQDALWNQADALAARFGHACVTLEPLHSLSDFCYVVRNEVVAAIGVADTAYAQGPCWEMDYNIRAARSGFRGVWAQGAFVHRAPPCPRRSRLEDSLLDTSKRLYQDRFCAWRGEAQHPPAPYHAHCAGEQCRYFAMPERMRIFVPPAAALAPPQPVPDPAPVAGAPLLSCIMPTRARPAFVEQSIRYFQRQDYPALELIIVYEEDSDLPAGISDERIRCVRVAPRTSIGAKRNEAVRLARGELVAHWDDDDWYGEQRLSRQAAPILHNIADITGLNDMLFMARAQAEFWAPSRALFRRMFVENVSGGSLLFRRSLWETHGRYPATSLREDADFLLKVLAGGARLCRLPGRELHIYVRHDNNTWKFREGHYLQQTAWARVPQPPCLERDRDFYFPPAATVPAPMAAARPLVSCIMPTADRRDFVPQAIRNFLAQDYGPRELIVLDDGRDSVADLIPSHEAIHYMRLERKLSLGAKRNVACEMARGELIAHWDDDDWMAPGWLSSQVRALLEQGADICGLDKVFFYAPEGRRAWQYVYDGRSPWVCGGTLCYRREFWRGAPFADINVGEDNAFVWAPRHKRIVVNPDQHLYVARVHPRNTSPKETLNRRWRNYPVEQVERLML
ncbi:glycosyl transferase [Polaromonas sp. CF318]|uniref:glycosyltransferase family A protein n=1 Tax=Polaromonas sp. CF318 TaxID=1144318 RepID=UPI0002711F3A|nr:glycosyltransferase family A protein [Polaromonas sp. CF318]EJL83269.1 glycosyl transferase [Polaromonas sp. CF318]